MKHLLITGSSGLLGSNINHELENQYDVYGVSLKRPNPYLKNQFMADLTDKGNIKRIFELSKPDYIIHCAATTSIDACEIDYHAAYRSNVLATENLVSLTDNSTKFIYISTDALFDGIKGHYRETDTPVPLNNYAKTKLEGEHVVEETLKNYCIVRTNMFGKNIVGGESFAEWIINSLNAKKTISMFTDVIFSPLNVRTLATYLEKLLVSNFTGRINLASTDTISKYDFGKLFAEAIAMDEALIVPVSVDDFPFKAKRPKNMSLDTTIAENIFGKMPVIKEEITRFANQLK